MTDAMDPHYAAVHAEEDRAHWWFVGRRAVLLAEMARRLPRGGLRVVEIGCGSGGMLEALSRFGTPRGIESDPVLRERARERGLDARPGALPDNLPLEAGAWDAVCLFDVLEHVEDEGGSLRACRRLLAPRGRFFVTVPAYAWLWSRHDELLGHPVSRSFSSPAPTRIDVMRFRVLTFMPLAGVAAGMVFQFGVVSM